MFYLTDSQEFKFFISLSLFILMEKKSWT